MPKDYKTIADNISFALHELYRVYYSKANNKNLQFDSTFHYIRTNFEELDKLWRSSQEADCEQRVQSGDENSAADEGSFNASNQAEP